MITRRPGETWAEAGKWYDKKVPPHLANDFALHGHLRNVFHLAEVGEDAFRNIDIILITDYRLGVERLIWRDKSTWQLHEARLPLSLFDRVATEFLQAYARSPLYDLPTSP